MQTLYLFRHGQTDFNLQGIVQGSGVDAPLNETGRAQARAFFEAYRHLAFDAVFGSELQRTQQTLTPWKEVGYEFHITPALNEISWGVLEGKKGNPEIRKEFERVTGLWERGNLDVAIEGGESPIEAWNRAEPFFKMLRDSHPSANLLLCSHGRMSRVILANLLQWGMERMKDFPHYNTGLNIIEIGLDGKVHPKALNDTSHLS